MSGTSGMINSNLLKSKGLSEKNLGNWALHDDDAIGCGQGGWCLGGGQCQCGSFHPFLGSGK